MKYTVSLLLLLAICHAAEESREQTKKQEEDDNYTAKRELLEGNYGLKIQSAVSGTELQSSAPTSADLPDNDQQKQKHPTQDNGPSRVPLKVSDVLVGQGVSFPAAIAGQLYSPLQIYQPNLRYFDVSPPVASQLAYSEHTFNNYLNSQFIPDFESLRLQQPQFHQQNYVRHESLTDTTPTSPSQSFILNLEDDEEIIQNKENVETQKLVPNLAQNTETSSLTSAEQPRQGVENTRQDNIKTIENVKQQEVQQQQITQQQSLQVNQQTLTELQPPRPDVAVEQFLPRYEAIQPQTRPTNSEKIIQQVFPEIEGFPADFFQQINELGKQLSSREESIQIENLDEEKEYGAKKQNKTKKQNDEQVATTGTPTTLQEPSSTPQVTYNQNAVSYARYSQGFQPTNQVQLQSQKTLQVLQPLTPVLQVQPLPSPSPILQTQELPLIHQTKLFQTAEPLTALFKPESPQPWQPLQPVYQPILHPTVVPFYSFTPQTLFTPNQQRRVIIKIRNGTTSSPESQSTLTTQATPHVLTTLNSQLTFSSRESTIEVSSTESTTVPSRSTEELIPVTTPLSITPKILSSLATKTTELSSPSSTSLVTSTIPPSTLSTQSVTYTPQSSIVTRIPPTQQPLQSTLIPLQITDPQTSPVISQPQIQPILQPVQVLTALPSPTQQSYAVPQSHHEIPGIRAVPVQRYQPELQPLVNVQREQQLQFLQLQGSPYAPPHLVQLLQSQYQPQSQTQAQIQSGHTGQPIEKPLDKSKNQQSVDQLKQQLSEQYQYQQHHHQQLQQEQQAISHAQNLLHNLYSSYVQKPVYSDAQDILIPQTHAGLASPSYPVFQGAPTSVQYFGKYAPEIFGGNYLYKKK